MWKNCKDGVRIPYAICRGDHWSPVDFVTQNPSPQGERQIIFLRKIRKTLFFGGRPRVAPTFPFEEDRFQQNRPSITAVIASRRRTPGWPLLPFGQFTFWQSPGRQFVILRSTRRFPRGVAPRHDRFGGLCGCLAWMVSVVRRCCLTPPYKKSPNSIRRAEASDQSREPKGCHSTTRPPERIVSGDSPPQPVVR